MPSSTRQQMEKRPYHTIIYIHRMYFRRRFNALGPLVDCRGLVSIRPEFVCETSMVKMEGKEGKCERFRSLGTFRDATINYYCMCGELIVHYINQKAAPTYHFVALLFPFSFRNFEARSISQKSFLILHVRSSPSIHLFC